MYAIIETGGKQIKVFPGKTIKVEKLCLDKRSDVTFEKVLAVAGEDKIVYGSPYIEGARVLAKVESEGKSRKVLVFKQKPRKTYRTLRGHRQPYTSLKIEEIVFRG